MCCIVWPATRCTFMERYQVPRQWALFGQSEPPILVWSSFAQAVAWACFVIVHRPYFRPQIVCFRHANNSTFSFVSLTLFEME
jgi:hypothetical protein